jgi:hypothetical protein
VQHRAALHRLRKQWGDQQAALRQQKQAAAVKRAAAAAAAKAEAKGRREAKQRAEAKEEQLHLQEEAQERVRSPGCAIELPSAVVKPRVTVYQASLFALTLQCHWCRNSSG